VVVADDADAVTAVNVARGLGEGEEEYDDAAGRAENEADTAVE
jgi:hypothetical protein